MKSRNAAILLSICIAIIVIHALVMYSIRPYGYNLSSMIRISDNREKNQVAPEYFQKGLIIFKDGGYDGQAYYYVAMDPFMQERYYRDAYRYQRILYPLLSRLMAFGNEQFIPYSMYLVNLLSLAAGMFFFMMILEHYGLSPWWSLFYGLSPPSIMTIQYDLPSPLSIALIVAAIYFYLKDRLPLTAALFALSFLTREDSVVIFAPLVLWDIQTHRSFRRLAMLAASLIPFFAWQYYVTAALGALPTTTSSEAISIIPFSGIIGYVKTLRYEGLIQFLKAMSNILVFLYLLAIAVINIFSLTRERHLFYYIVAAYSILMMFTVPSQWDNYNGLLRMFYGLFPFLVLSYGIEKNALLKYGVYFSGVLIFLTFIRILFVSPVYQFQVWQ